MAKIPVLEDGKVVARVEYNEKLDYWDGRNYACGTTGRHLGYTQLKSGKWVLIHGTQWQGEKDWAEVVTAEELVQAAARTNSLEFLYENHPELKGLLEDDEAEFVETEFEAEIVAFGNGAHITVPKEHIGKKVKYRIID